MSTTISSETPLFIVIGGGWSGLYALKYLLAEGLQARLYERESFLGGIWHYKQTDGGVYRTTHTTSSKTFMHASDFPFPSHIRHFPAHYEIHSFLEKYVDTFNLRPHMFFQHHVINIQPIKNPSSITKRWVIRLRYNNEEFEEYCQGIVISSGQHQTPTDPRYDEPFKNFTGTVSHSFQYKFPLPEYKDKTILIVGGGETASDIAVELSPITKSIYMSIRQGQWFQGRLVGDQPADLTLTMLMRLWTYYDSYFVRVGAQYFVQPIWGKGGTGIPEWEPKCRFMHGFLNKSREVVDKVGLGFVVPKRGITNIHQQMVTFETINKSNNREKYHNIDNEDQLLTESDTVHIDHIIYCTGYRWNHPFFDENLAKETAVLRLYQLIFPVNLPGLAFVGSARPVFGSIPSLAELQARRVAQVFSGRAQLPTENKMQKALNAYWKRHERLYPFDKRMKQLVNQFEYSDIIADELHVRPCLWHLFFRHPCKWYKVYCASPWTPFLYRLGKIESKEEKLAYKRHIACIPRSDQTFHIFNRPLIYTWIILLILILIIFISIIFVLVFKFAF